MTLTVAQVKKWVLSLPSWLAEAHFIPVDGRLLSPKELLQLVESNPDMLREVEDSVRKLLDNGRRLLEIARSVLLEIAKKRLLSYMLIDTMQVPIDRVAEEVVNNTELGRLLVREYAKLIRVELARLLGLPILAKVGQVTVQQAGQGSQDIVSQIRQYVDRLVKWVQENPALGLFTVFLAALIVGRIIAMLRD